MMSHSRNTTTLSSAASLFFFSSEFNHTTNVYSGGTAGCVVASRLSENPSIRVLLLERGPVTNTWSSRVPLISSNFTRQNATVYRSQSTPLASLGGKTLPILTGKALGGSSRISGLIYGRSVPGEYNAWELSGRQGWGWKQVEPVFKMSEKSLSHGKSSFRGTHGNT
jgi:choline dehydrogenase-like flavoprotein